MITGISIKQSSCRSALIMIIVLFSTSVNILPLSAKRAPSQDTDWQSLEVLAIESERQGDFKTAESYYLKAKKDLLHEAKESSTPASSFSARWFPLQNALRSLYLNRASTQENSLPFSQIDQCYKKALAIPGTSMEMWDQYADFLRRKGKTKQAEKVEKEGKKKSLYSTNQG